MREENNTVPDEQSAGDSSAAPRDRVAVKKRLQNIPRTFIMGKEGLFLIVLVIVIALTSWGVVSHIESRVKHDVGKSLQTTLHTSHLGVLNQLNSQKKAAQVWAHNGQVLTAINQLKRLPPIQKALSNSPAQKNLRSWISSLINSVGYRGFFVINKNNINLASSRDRNIGVVSLLSKDFLDRVWAGETLVSLPQPSDVPLKDVSGQLIEGLATMFVATPVQSKTGDVIAILAFRLEPVESFMPVILGGHLGDSGETYAFNKNGLLLSESRFKDQIAQIELITGNRSDLKVEARDPGVDLTKGATPSLARQQMPLTRMAQSATRGESSSNLGGYRDYRGVPVVGAWLWDHDLGFGFATEINVEEAFASFYETRLVIYIFAALSISTLIVLAYISNRGRKELAVRERRYRNSQKYANIGTWDWNIQTGDLLWSEMIAPLFGYDHKTETTYENFVQAIHPDDRELVTNAVQACVDQDTKYDVEHRVVWPDGTVHWVREEGGVERSKDGTPVRMLGVVIDIDDRKTADEQLTVQMKELDFQKFALDEHAIVSITNPQGNIIYANDKFCTISEYSRDELIGQNHRIVKSSEHSAEFFRDLWDTVMQGNVWQGEIKNRAKSGKSYWVMTTIVPSLGEDGKPFQYISIRTDITERKKAELAAMSANRAKSDIMANMSHELRTPLNAIIGFSDTMREEVFGPVGHDKYREYLNDINYSGKHLLDLINDILDVSAIEAGSVILNEETLQLSNVVEAAIRIVGPRADMGKVTVANSIESTLPQIYVDERRLKQICLNLLSNAVKFTNEGGEVSITSWLNSDGSLSFGVSDTGIGMDEAELSVALSAFGQVDSGLNRMHEGTGLGLPLTKGLIELHGGTMDVKSQKGHGTMITVTFPKERVVPGGATS